MLKVTRLTQLEDVYDITVEGNHNFFADGICVHNCVEVGMMPVTADGESGFQFCLAGSTDIMTDKGYRTIDSLVEANEFEFIVKSAFASDTDTPTGNQCAMFTTAAQLFYTGEKETFRITSYGETTVEATGNHKFMTQDGYVAVDDLDINHHQLYLAEGRFVPITSIEPAGVQKVYDISVKETHNFVTNGIVTHNCNLTEINGGVCTDVETFMRACKAAAILGTVQAGYTNFKYVSDATTKITEREALIGVSITGWMNNPDILFDKTNMIEGATLVKNINKQVAKLIGINPAARSTCAKPSGNACTTLDTVIRTEFADISMGHLFTLMSNGTLIDSVVAGTYFPAVAGMDFYVFDENNNKQKIINFYINGLAQTYDIEFDDGQLYSFTGEHKLKTQDGWKRVDELSKSDLIDGYHQDDDTTTFDPIAGKVTTLNGRAREQYHQKSIVFIEFNPELRMTVDIEVEKTHSYQLQNGAVSHNSVILGTASGIHGEHAPKYFRHVQMNAEDEVAKLIMEKNPKMVEQSVWSANGTDVVVAFPVETKEGSLYKHDLLGTKQLEYVKLAQNYWVEAGTTVELCADSRLRHNISNTITVDDWDEVEQYIYDNRAHFAGISLLSAAGDRAYVQAPFAEVFDSKQILDMYGEGSLFASGLVVDALHAFNENLWQACETAIGQGLKLSEDNSADVLKRDWVRRAKKFATSYFEGDMQKMTFCLKDCYNLHKWCTINNSIEEIVFASDLSKKQYTEVDSLAAVGCSGGVCEITF